MTREDHLQMVEDCEERESRLSDWERGFISSIQQQLEKGKTLSSAQERILRDTWDCVTDGG